MTTIHGSNKAEAPMHCECLFEHEGQSACVCVLAPDELRRRRTGTRKAILMTHVGVNNRTNYMFEYEWSEEAMGSSSV